MSLNPYVMLGTAGAWLLSLAVCGWLMYARGHDDMRNAFTEQALTTANRNLADSQKQQNRQAAIGASHDKNQTQINIDTSAIARTLNQLLAKLPAGSDPFVPVWFVRMHDRAASRWTDADPYPGKSDGDPSDVRLSQALAMLTANYGKCETNRVQLRDTIDLKPVLPNEIVPPKKSLLDNINPF